MGTPFASASTVEFHPQWLRKAPVEGWLRIINCGAHPRITSPRWLSSACLARSSGKYPPPPPGGPPGPMGPACRTQMKGLRDSSSAAASSSSSSSAGPTSVPKDM
ncbi:unnamed protein product [Spirodela intermedia]|uniref:Uncharacterized protein n=1 Tax=Spirodela intermedia TaxID=51605 RepID=A0A7I8L8X9_SPIIN|nr:unnamed protein product [Spirodela intermedia]